MSTFEGVMVEFSDVRGLPFSIPLPMDKADDHSRLLPPGSRTSPASCMFLKSCTQRSSDRT
jgi:hypothetical protein